MPSFSARTAVLLVACIALTACDRPAAETAHVYSTEYGLGPDKWATAWLLTHKAESNARLEVVPAGTTPNQGTVFDMPAAPIRRMTARAAFEVALETLKPVDPVLARMAQIVHEIEVDFWSADTSIEADTVEHAYRELQQRYGREAVTPECYVAFFDRVYSVLNDVEKNGASFDTDRLNLGCDELVQVANRDKELVPEVPIADVLSAMAAGRRVVFVDVREADEFAEGHIPDALNIPLRDVGPHLAERFKGADYVVSYCVKDFRGFEMARALAEVGVEHSVIMRPYGIKGWTTLGLPITGQRAMSEQAAREALERCLAARGECLTQRGMRAST